MPRVLCALELSHHLTRGSQRSRAPGRRGCTADLAAREEGLDTLHVLFQGPFHGVLKAKRRWSTPATTPQSDLRPQGPPLSRRHPREAFGHDRAPRLRVLGFGLVKEEDVHGQHRLPTANFIFFVVAPEGRLNVSANVALDLGHRSFEAAREEDRCLSIQAQDIVPRNSVPELEASDRGEERLRPRIRKVIEPYILRGSRKSLRIRAAQQGALRAWSRSLGLLGMRGLSG